MHTTTQIEQKLTVCQKMQFKYKDQSKEKEQKKKEHANKKHSKSRTIIQNFQTVLPGKILIMREILD